MTTAPVADIGPLDAWEARWSPYDEATYAAALAAIEPTDVVLDIGAGDLRLARRIAARARQVVAWEIRAELLAAWRAEPGAGSALRSNLAVVCTDARVEPVPIGVTVGVLLMRHCTHYALYVEKLRAAGCRRLVTNARWGMGIEVIDLGPGVPFDSIDAGWYACRRCGAVGFAGTTPEQLDETVLESIADAEGCPACLPAFRPVGGPRLVEESGPGSGLPNPFGPCESRGRCNGG